MLTRPWFVRRIGVKTPSVLGMFACVCATLLRTGIGQPWCGYSLWELFSTSGYDFFFRERQFYWDQKAPAALARRSARPVTFITYGIAMFHRVVDLWPVFVDAYMKSAPTGALLHVGVPLDGATASRLR